MAALVVYQNQNMARHPDGFPKWPNSNVEADGHVSSSSCHHMHALFDTGRCIAIIDLNYHSIHFFRFWQDQALGRCIITQLITELSPVDHSTRMLPIGTHRLYTRSTPRLTTTRAYNYLTLLLSLHAPYVAPGPSSRRRLPHLETHILTIIE